MNRWLEGVEEGTGGDIVKMSLPSHSLSLLVSKPCGRTMDSSVVGGSALCDENVSKLVGKTKFCETEIHKIPPTVGEIVEFKIYVCRKKVETHYSRLVKIAEKNVRQILQRT